MKNLAALAFVPERLVIDEFNQIKENAEDILDGEKSSHLFFQVILLSDASIF